MEKANNAVESIDFNPVSVTAEPGQEFGYMYTEFVPAFVHIEFTTVEK